MASETHDLYDFDAMTDDEIYDVVVQQLREYPNLDADWIEVDVRRGEVTLSGRVGTDGEVQVAAKVVTEVLGVERFRNELVVSESHRGTAPEAADDSVAEDLETDDQMGEDERNHSDTSGHLVDDLDTQTYGTHDVSEAIEEGASYSPPDRPIADGYDSRENH